MLLFLLCLGLPLFLRAAVFLSQSVCPPGPRRAVPSREPGREGARLVICPVKDDLNEAALESVVQAAQGWGRVVVAEDGEGMTKSERQNPMDGARARGAAAEAGAGSGFGIWHSSFPDLIYFRREGRSGWKAGNVRAALAAHGAGVREFVIMDADTVAPAGFLAALSARGEEMTKLEGQNPKEGEGAALPAGVCPSSLHDSSFLRASEFGLRHSRSPAFIQARLEWNPSQPGALPRWMGPSVGLHFRTAMRARAERGFTMFHGHAAIINMEAYEEAGGLPEIVSEDLGLTLRLRVRGWQGAYADDLVAYEDFPPTVAAWRRRQDKWLRGTLECLRREAGPFLKAPHIPRREKFDMLLNAAWLYLSPLGLAWFAGLALLQPAAMAAVRQPAQLLKTPAWELTPDLWHWLDGVRLTVLWSGPVCAVMFFMMLAPLVPALAALRENRQSLRTEHCALSTAH